LVTGWVGTTAGCAIRGEADAPCTKDAAEPASKVALWGGGLDVCTTRVAVAAVGCIGPSGRPWAGNLSEEPFCSGAATAANGLLSAVMDGGATRRGCTIWSPGRGLCSGRTVFHGFSTTNVAAIASVAAAAPQRNAGTQIRKRADPPTRTPISASGGS